MNRFEFRWTIPHDHPAFAGHFPERPIVPGVVLLDCLLLAMIDKLPEGAISSLSIGTAKFLSPALPGEELLCSVQEKSAGTYQFSIANLADRNIASGNFSVPV